MSVLPSPTNTVHGLAEWIVALPYQLGYRPTRSLVLACLGAGVETGSGSTRIAPLTARVDLPAPGDEQQVLDAISAPLRRPETQAAIAVIFDDDPGAPVHSEFLDQVAVVATAHGADLCVRAQVCGASWVHLPSAGAVPSVRQRVGWRPLPASHDVPAIAAYVLAGRSPLQAREHVAEVFRRSDGHLAAAAAQEYAAMRSSGAALGRSPTVRDQALRTLRNVIQAEGASLPAGLTAADVASVAIALNDIGWRDALLEVLSAGRLGPAGQPPARLTSMRHSLAVPGADPAGVPFRLAALAGHLPADVAPSLLSVVAFLAWCRGDGAVANIAIESALRLDPCYSLAVLIDRALQLALPPPGVSGQRLRAYRPGEGV